MSKRIRLISGLILFTFLTCHLFNLSFGLASLQALDESRQWLLWFWSTGVGIALLVGSMVAHLMLGLFALYRRNTLRMTMTDTVQLVLGLVIFPLLFGHLLGNVIGPMMTGVSQNYYSILTLFWVLDPGLGLKQVIVTVIAIAALRFPIWSSLIRFCLRVRPGIGLDRVRVRCAAEIRPRWYRECGAATSLAKTTPN
jgi:adenylate cyclase